jgi:hypothetical protein
MRRIFNKLKNHLTTIPFNNFWQPIKQILRDVPPLVARGDRPLQMTFEDQLKALVFFYLEEHASARFLI